MIVADDLGPADAIQLLRSTACGIAIDLGSASSHTAILARALDIPAVVGVRGLTRLVADDELVIVDAFRGEVIVRPSEEEMVQARARGDRYREFTRGLRGRSTHAPITRDGTEIRLDANVELPPEAALALQEGADGHRPVSHRVPLSRPQRATRRGRADPRLQRRRAGTRAAYRWSFAPSTSAATSCTPTRALLTPSIPPSVCARSASAWSDRSCCSTQLRAILRASCFGDGARHVPAGDQPERAAHGANGCSSKRGASFSTRASAAARSRWAA